MCSLIELLPFVKCHASKNSLLFHREHLSKIVTLLKSKSCPVCQMGISVKGGDGSRVFSGSHSLGERCQPDVNHTAVICLLVAFSTSTCI